MRHVEKPALMSALEVRKQENLPADGRQAFKKLERLEEVLRRVMHPDVPTFDVNSVQLADFDEWTYTEGMGFLLAFTQSVEINARLALAAAQWDGEIQTDYAAAIADHLADKWQLEPTDAAIVQGRSVFFPPGANLGWIINKDNVLRAFAEDSAWILKPHPVTSAEDIRAAKQAFGITRILRSDSSGMGALRVAGKVGYTTASEMGLVAMLRGTPTQDFTLYEFEHRGRYHPFYFAVRRTPRPPRDVLNRIFNCPWSGAVHLSLDSGESERRLRLYKERSLDYRERFSPLLARIQINKPVPQPQKV